ncbi:NAD(P)H-binding protein [Bradyrhizobium sp. A5]|uniref:NmrA family NAD(P)-binding protein n=1 Tax=Bradyrhizobium sp. A5 TaxID=3133696 RepID=UPI003243E408
MTKTILVTSAAGGTQGRTGRHVSEMLLERGVRVRALVRQIDERSDHLKSLGAEILVGDFLDVRSVEQAARGVASIYFAYPVQDGLADATAAMAFAARKHGVSRLVNLVMYQSSIDAPTPRMRQNYLSEQVFEWAGVGPLHLRATVFYENVARLVGASLPARGAIRLPLGNESTILPLISAEDVSRIAVGLLTGPERGAGTAYPVIGSVNSVGDIVAAFARVFDRDVHYEEVSDEQWRSEVLARGWNSHAVEHLSSLWKSLRAARLSAETARFAVTDAIEKIGGASPKTFEQFVRERQSELVAPKVAANASTSPEGRT